MILAGFPPPPARGIDLPGPFFLNFYTLVIILGGILAVVVATRLWKSRGGNGDDVFSATTWAVILGIIGARIYHVISSPDAYFGEGGDVLRALRVWEGGLSIIGAVAAGSLGIWIACRRYGMKFGALADAVVPGVILAQAIGRWGNWFNQELFGRTTELPWGLRIDLEQASQAPLNTSESTLFHPTFLYESIWNLLGFVALLWLFRRFQFKQGLLTWTYVAYYALGRFWIESLRIDEPTKSTQYPLRELLGLDWRLNQIIMFVIFVVAIAMLLYLWARRPRTPEALAEELEIYRPDSEARTGADEGAGEVAVEASEESAADQADSAEAVETPEESTRPRTET